MFFFETSHLDTAVAYVHTQTHTTGFYCLIRRMTTIVKRGKLLLLFLEKRWNEAREVSKTMGLEPGP